MLDRTGALATPVITYFYLLTPSSAGSYRLGKSKQSKCMKTGLLYSGPVGPVCIVRRLSKRVAGEPLTPSSGAHALGPLWTGGCTVNSTHRCQLGCPAHDTLSSRVTFQNEIR